jgi:hypothetical protein
VKQCFLALMWLGDPERGEIERRNTVAAANVDVEGRPPPGAREKIGPRIAVVVEEQNELTTRLRRWWENRGQDEYAAAFGGSTRPPAIDALDSAHFTARQVFTIWWTWARWSPPAPQDPPRR